MEPKQIGWSQESILLYRISKELERLAGIIASGGGGGGGTVGGLRTLDSLPLDTTLKLISDSTGVQSPLRLSTTSVTNYGAGNIDTNTVFGKGAFTKNTTGFGCTIVGVEAGGETTQGQYVTAIGAYALGNSTSNGVTQNTAVGAFAATGVAGLNSGDANTAIGAQALYGLAGGEHNIAIGYLAMKGNAGNIVFSASNNIAIGDGAGSRINSGGGNIIIGTEGGVNGITTGNNNIIIGIGSTNIITGSGNVVLGRFLNTLTDTTNTVYIGDGAGVLRFISDSTFLTRVPAQTNALITGDATGKAVVTKEFLATTGVTINGTLVPLGGSTSFTTPAQTTVVNSLASNHSNSTITRTTVPGWTFTVTAGKRYRVEISALYQTAVVTTGGSIGFILSSGTGTIRGIMEGEIVQTVAATGLRATIRDISNVNTLAGSFMTTTGVNPINSPHYMGGVLTFTCVTTGVFEVQFGSEVAASAAQLNAGSILLVTEY